MCDIRRLRLYWNTKFKGVKNFRLSLSLLVLTAILLPVLGKETYINIKKIQSYTQAFQDKKNPLEYVDGIYLPQKAAEAIKTKVDYLSKRKSERPLILTENTYTIPLMAKYYPEHGLLDINMELPSRKYPQIIQQILQAEVAEIWFDEVPPSPRYTRNQDKLWKQIRTDISNKYYKKKNEQGWEIWTRKQTD